MKHHGFIDSENRKGKTPGAMCMPLMDHQCGFILANCVGTNADVGTLAHEGGHAIHDASMSELPIELYRDAITFPMELAEVGSMTMEFLVLDHLDVIYTNEEDIRQAKIQALIEPIIFLPWCAIVDAFQQWIYTNLNHTHEERMEKFSELMDQFEIASGVDYSGLEEQKPLRWLRQNHIFQMPFYYIEYGISQLAAVGIYRNYKKDKQKAVEQFHQMLKLGNSKSMPEIYKAGGIPFDFSETYIGELMDFLVSELASLDAYGFGSK
jgi:oligoendopeptidase F